MTREEAIKRLYELQFYSSCKVDERANMADIWRETVSALDMAIAALREQEEYEIKRHLKHFDIKEPRPEPVTKCHDLYDEDGGEILNQGATDTNVVHKTEPCPWCKSMTDEELADYMSDHSIEDFCYIVCGGNCKAMATFNKTSHQVCREIVADWLRQPYKEDAQ